MLFHYSVKGRTSPQNVYICSKLLMALRRKLSIFFMTWAALIVLIAGIIPHHHHYEGTTCMVVEHCHNAASPEHEHMHDHSSPTCIARSYFLSGAVLRTKSRISTEDDSEGGLPTLIYPLLSIVTDLLQPIDDSASKPVYGEYIAFYTSADASPAHGLRAPPFFSC